MTHTEGRPVTIECLLVTGMPQSLNYNTVSIAALIDLIDACRTYKALPTSKIQALDRPLTQQGKADQRIDEAALINLWNGIAEADQPGIALEIGQKINPDAKGLLASWISQTSTLREALEIFTQNISLMNPSENWEIKEQHNSCSLVFTLAGDKGYPQQAIERSMSAMISWGQALSGHTFPIVEAGFTFEEPAYANMFSPIFGENIRFNHSQNILTFDAHLLDLPVISSNQYLRELMEEKAKKALAEIDDKTPVRQRVKMLISDYLDSGQLASIYQISDVLAVSRQTLYRQLKQENTDFKSIVDSVRKETALQLLNDSTNNMDVISLKLGYKDTSSFYKAFRRWLGVSPKDYIGDK